MSIEIRSVSKASRAGNYGQVGTLSIQRPFNLQAKDVMVAAVAVTPRAFARSQDEGRFYHPRPPPGWLYVSSVPTVDADLFTFIRVAGASEPDNYVFEAQQTVNKVALDADPIKLLGGIIAYSGIDGAKAVNSLRTSDLASDALQVSTTRQNCRALLISLAVGDGADVNADTYTEWVGVDDLDGVHLQMADAQLTDAGPSGVETITSVGRVSRIMLALKPADALPEELLEASPPEQGSGAGLYERNPTKALSLRALRVQDGALIEEEEPVRPVALDVTFNDIGACTGGSLQFNQNPQWRPFSRVLELFYEPRLDGILYPPIQYYSCLVGIPVQDTNPEKIQQNVQGLYQIVANQPIGNDAFPVLPPVFEEAVVLFAGTPVTVAPNSKDIWQTWTEFLKKLLADHPNCHFGIGRDRKYVQGRPQDGNYVTIDANSPDVTEVNPSEFVVNEYVTHYYKPPNSDTAPVTTSAVRSDLDILTPRRTTTANNDGGGNLEIPAGFTSPVYQIGSYTLKLKGLLIPPALITNLPGGISQFVAGARFVVVGGQAHTEIHTEALPRKGVA